MAVEAGGASGTPRPPGGTKAIVWSGFVYFIDEDYGVVVDGKTVAAATIPPFTEVDAEQYQGFNDVVILASASGEIGQQAIDYWESTQPVPAGPPERGNPEREAGEATRGPSTATGGGTTGSGTTSGTGGSNVGVGNGGFGGGEGVDDPNAITASSTDEEIDAYVRKEIGYLAWMLDIPELRDLVFKALRGGTSEESVLAQLQNTEWWRTTEPQAREWTRLQAEDPAFADRLLRDVGLNIRLEAMRLGINLDPDKIAEMAGEAVTFGWVSLDGGARGNLLTQAIFNESLFRVEDLVAGDLAISIDELRQAADDYMIPISEDTAAVWAERIELGETSIEAFTKYIGDLAVSRFPHLKGIIEQGISPRSHFEPYRQQIAALLEVPADQVDLFNDPRFSDVVEMSTEQGTRSMTLAEAQKHIRKMPEWQSTSNGMATAARTANAVLEAFGETG